ncbi:MAG: tetraether lipid synthase Tes [Planctomycetota bacterium]
MVLGKLHWKEDLKKQNWELPCATMSLCPVCQEVINAELYKQDGQVLMNKTCAGHGTFTELISSDVEFFLKMRRTHYEMPVRVENPNCRNTSQCPNACGLCDQHLSTPAMINIDLTNRCNMNCPICFASSNATGRLYEISLEQLDMMLDAIMDIRPYQPFCIQLAGGEPTIHRDFIEAVRRVKSRGISYIQAATNGLRFAQSLEFCQGASDAGLNQVYLQFDGLDEDIYLKMRGRRMLDTKLQAIENISKTNMQVVLVPTLIKGLNDRQVGEITRFAIRNVDTITAISWQPVAITGRIDETKRRQMRYTTADLARDLEEQCGFINMYRDWYPFSVVEPFIRLMETTTKRSQMHCSCHPHCGCATYIIIDKHKHTAVPLPAFLDVEPAMQALAKLAARAEKYTWTKNFSLIQAVKSLRKHFHEDRAPEGWGFDDFLGFVKSFVEFDDQHADKAAYASDLRKQRFGTLLMASMHFQDSYNYEIDRSRHCLILYAAPNGRLYPFCTWNSGPCHRYAVEQLFSRETSQT